MKKYLLITVFLATSLFANYTYNGENSGKIDMHGGNTDKLIKGNFSNKKFGLSQGLGMKKPIKPKAPTAPKNLIKKQDKTPPSK